MGRPIKIPDNKKPKGSFVMIGIYPKTRIKLKKVAKLSKKPMYMVIDDLVNGRQPRVRVK